MAEASSSSSSIAEFCARGRPDRAFRAFSARIWAEPSLFAHLLGACLRRRSLRGAKQAQAVLIAAGAAGDRFLSNHLLNLYAKLGAMADAVKVFGAMRRRNVMSCNILLGGYILNDDLTAARRVFDEMPERNLATWNAMVSGLTDAGLNEQGLGLFGEMHRRGLRPDEFTLGSALRGCAGANSLAAGRQLHCAVARSGLESDLCVGSALAHMYMKCGVPAAAEAALASLPFLNVVAYNTVVAGRVQNGDAEGALEFFSQMRSWGLNPDKITFVSAIAACAELGTLGQGRQVHAQAIKAGADADTAARSSLVSMYSKCGCLGEAERVFVESDAGDEVLWSAMIAACGFHGRGRRAVELFEAMRARGMQPNEVTFLAVLYACSHAGMKEEGEAVFELMRSAQWVRPQVEHFTCMVDLLGRAGAVGTAEAVIRSMPVEPDAVIWKTLLAACKTHRETDTARRAAAELLRLDPLDSASYVLLSNVHAAAERWEDVEGVREAMRGRRVKKEPGISWLEMMNRVYQFSTGDRSHPRWREIEVSMGELAGKMKERGYMAETGIVLHDIEEEEKEESLACHSERIAVAFAVLSAPPGAEIRIMKNLRVCTDCHAALKLVSEITAREIVVRDVTRFHHFAGGACSCGDYW
ncbi:pentatricopeptide repeat-containing protein At2g41080-like [Wolffia australiana]